MLSYLESAGIVLVCVLLVLGVTSLLNRKMEDGQRKRANGVNGWQLSIIGSIYAVILGFTLSDAWLAFQTASADVRGEAAAALTIYRTSSLLPPACAVPIQDAAAKYVDTVVDTEWPAMMQQRINNEGGPILRAMWTVVNHCDTRGTELARDSVVHAMESLQLRRDARVEDYDGHLPAIMWVMLLIGAVSVIASSCLLGNEKQSVHSFHVLSLTILIVVTLLAISDLDQPFAGATRVADTAFRAVKADIGEHPAP